MRVLNLSFVLLLGVGAWSGCSKDGSSEAAPAASEGSESPPIPATGSVPLTKLTDGQIAQILAAVDSGEIEQAQLALQKSQDQDVRGFATHMVEQHTAAKQSGASLASQNGLKLADSPKAQELTAQGGKMLEQLKAADEKNFDITYLQAQTEQHAEVLKLIKDQLLPAVEDPSLRDYLSNARAMVEQHLDQAQKLQKQ